MASAAVFFRGAVTSTPKPTRLPVKRALFGCNSAAMQQANDSFCKQRLKQILDKKNKDWDFDFHNGVPMPSSSSTPATYVYKQLSNDLIPSFYHLAKLQRVSTTTSATSSTASSIECESESSPSMETDSDVENSENCSYESCFGYPRRLQQQQHRTPKKLRQASLNEFTVARRRKSASKKVISGSPRRSIRQMAASTSR